MAFQIGIHRDFMVSFDEKCDLMGYNGYNHGITHKSGDPISSISV
jgi:hypothetical protein